MEAGWANVRHAVPRPGPATASRPHPPGVGTEVGSRQGRWPKDSGTGHALWEGWAVRLPKLTWRGSSEHSPQLGRTFWDSPSPSTWPSSAWRTGRVETPAPGSLAFASTCTEGWQGPSAATEGRSLHLSLHSCTKRGAHGELPEGLATSDTPSRAWGPKAGRVHPPAPAQGSSTATPP